MPATTPNLSLPYPVPADTVDVPRDIQALANKLDAVAGGALVSTLPGTPTDGQEVYYLADPTGGVVWHLRYRAGSSSTYKWEAVGGPPLTAAYNGPSTSPAGIGTLSIPVPLAGEYLVAGGLIAQGDNAAGAVALTITRPQGGEPFAGSRPWISSTVGGYWRHVAHAEIVTPLTVGTMTGNANLLGGAPVVFQAWMRAQPVRVG